MKYLYKTIFYFLLILALTPTCFAASLKLDTVKQNYDIGEEFYIDLILDTNGKSINGVEGSLTYSKNNLEFLRAENGLSFITYWVQTPMLQDGRINFSGIVSNGFSGFLNDADSSTAGIITRLVFKPIKSGQALITSGEIIATLNDGNGTTQNITSETSVIDISTANNPKSYNKDDINKPTLNAEIVKNENLNSGKPTLVFNAIDKESGIEGIYLKQKDSTWVKIQNPYLLEGNNISGLLTVKAVDFSGNSETKRFILPAYVPAWGYIVFLILIGLTIYVIKFLYKIYVKKNI